MEKIYTWKDLERIFNKYSQGENCILNAEVYSDEVLIFSNEPRKDVQEELYNLLDYHYNEEHRCVNFDMFDKSLPIVWMGADESLDNQQRRVLPLFKKIVYSTKAYDSKIIEDNRLDKCPIIAFHSYKGGVGRTLSLLTFIKAWSENIPNEKVLIIDSDIEAPGLTWMWENDEYGNEISYLDLLEMIQTSDFDNVEIQKKIVEQISMQTIKIDNGKRTAEYFFVPTYRYIEQLMDMYANPESIALGFESQYCLAEKLSELGKQLGVKKVFVDLRAGLSEFSAPLLFDPRVKKYIVSSTSFQSVKGTLLIIKEMLKGLPITEESNLPQILLTMVTNDVNTSDIKNEFLKAFDIDKTEYIDNVVVELPFASELIHLESIEQIIKKLEGRDFYNNISTLVKEIYDQSNTENVLPQHMEDREHIIASIHEVAENQINAEQNNNFNVLMTAPIKNLVKAYGESVPQAVIIGAKGAGKTFLYRELLGEKKWNAFCMNHSNLRIDKETYIIPLIAPKNIGNMNELLRNAISFFQKNSKLATNDLNYWYQNGQKLIDKIGKIEGLLEWKEIWGECLLNAFDLKKYSTLKQVEETLKKEGYNILFVVDGLEEIFEDTLDDKMQKNAIRALVQELLNEIKILYPHIGMLVFLRKDLSNNSIETNREQFEGQNRKFMLNWTHDEALRLALWLVSKAVPGFYDEKEIPIEEASKDVVKRNLDRVWGLKLGKRSSNEAYSSRWILAALSDFHAQLQARDIIRFLANATEETGNVVYEDRVIMPKEIKNAVHACSEKKVEEIKQEMKHLIPIFEKLEKASDEKKLLPFSAITFNLDAKQENIMIQEGFLKREGDKYYLPEIIRHALNFKYEKGARPKVLSLVFGK